MSNFDMNKFVMTSKQHSATICQYIAESDCAIPDVKIVCQGGVAKFSHRIMLASASPTFLRPLLESSNSEEISTLLIPDISAQDLSRILEIIYVGETRLGLNYIECLDSMASLGIQLDKISVEPWCQNSSVNLKTEDVEMLDCQAVLQEDQIKSEKMYLLENDKDRKPLSIFEQKRDDSILSKLFCLLRPTSMELPIFVLQFNNNNNNVTQFPPQNLGMKCLLDGEHVRNEIKEEKMKEFDHQVAPTQKKENSIILQQKFLKSEMIKEQDDNFKREEIMDCSEVNLNDNLCEGKFQLLKYVTPQEVHVNDKPYGCEYPRCSDKFRTQSEFRVHRRACNKSTAGHPRPISSQESPFMNAKKLSSTSHLIPSSPMNINFQQKFSCPKCKEKFKSATSLKTHLVAHLDDLGPAVSITSGDHSIDAMFTCKFCQINHSSWTELSSHVLKVHETPKSFFENSHNNSYNINNLISSSTPQLNSAGQKAAILPNQDVESQISSTKAQQQQQPVSTASSSLTITSAEIPFVIANHLSRLTPDQPDDPPSLLLPHPSNSNSKQRWFVQSGEHINGRTCLGLSNKIEAKNPKKSFVCKNESGSETDEMQKQKEITASIISRELSKLTPNNIENLRSNRSKKKSFAPPMNKSIECQICKTLLKSAKSYKRHMDQCHSSGRPKHVCILCQRTFKRSDNLTAHYRSVHCGLKPNNCKCGKGYRTKNELLRHCKNSCPVSRTAMTPTPPTILPTTTTFSIPSPAPIEIAKNDEIVLDEAIEDPSTELDLSHGYFSDLDFEYDVNSTNDFIQF